MKAWLELENDPDKIPGATSNSSWYIYDGCKIEKFDTGTIKLYNCLTMGERFERIEGALLDIFTNKGWDAGVSIINIDYLENKINLMSKHMHEAGSKRHADLKQERFCKLVKNLERYRSKAKNLGISLNDE